MAALSKRLENSFSMIEGRCLQMAGYLSALQDSLVELVG